MTFVTIYEKIHFFPEEVNKINIIYFLSIKFGGCNLLIKKSVFILNFIVAIFVVDECFDFLTI